MEFVQSHPFAQEAGERMGHGKFSLHTVGELFARLREDGPDGLGVVALARIDAEIPH